MNVRAFLKIAQSASPYRYGLGLFAYMFVLVLATDCLVWASAGSLGSVRWEVLALYSAFSHPLWSLMSAKGILKEQSDVIISQRWGALDFLPNGAVQTMLGHAVGQTFKTRVLWLWFIAQFLAFGYFGAPAYFYILSPLLIIAGYVNMCLLLMSCIMLAPKGYAGVISSIVSSLCFVLSGAVVPLRLLGVQHFNEMLNPISAVVSIPVGMILNCFDSDQKTYSFSDLTLILASAMSWSVVLYFLCTSLERSRRVALHS